MSTTPLNLEEHTLFNRLKHRLGEKWRRRRGPSPASPDERLGAALIGVGNVARWLYLPRFQSPACPFRLRAVYDTQTEAARKVAATFQAQACSSLKELLDSDVQAVFICTPPAFHKESVLAAAAAGKHLLCEKPLATTAAEARLLCNTAEQAQVVHMVNFTFRFRPDLVLVRRILESGRLGRLYHVWGTLSQGGWFNEHGQPSRERTDAAPWKYEAGGGVASDLGPHLLDLVRCWMGDIREVRAWTRSFRPEPNPCEDACGLSLTCAGGGVAHLLTSRWNQGARERTLFEFAGSEGALRLDQDKVCLWTNDAPEWRRLFVPRPDTDFLAAFHQAILGRPSAIPTFQDARKNNEALEAVMVSGQTGQAVSLPLDAASADPSHA